MLLMSSKHPHPLIRELWREPIVTALLGIAGAFVIARTALLDVKQVFPGGARIGDVLFELALAYVGAWIFNLLIVVRPRVRDRSRVLAGAGPLVARLSEIGRATPAMLAEAVHVPTPEFDAFDEGWLSANTRSLAFGAPSPSNVPDGTHLRALTWHEWVVDMVSRTRATYASLVPYFPYLEIELIGLINDVVLSDFIQRGDALSSTAPVAGNMSSLAADLGTFVRACEALHGHYSREVAG